jgi:folate-binding protein YgfZ
MIEVSQKNDTFTGENFLGYIHVPGGEQAAKFLQGQVTCDVRAVTEENSLLGAHCDPKGRVQFIFRLFKQDDDFYLQLLRELIPHAISLLQKYAQFFRIKLEEANFLINDNEEFENWRLRNIQSGVPTVHKKTVGLFTPHQINLQLLNAVSFNKGCYTGQEIIARMQYLGKLKQQMYRVNIESEKNFVPGAKLYNTEGQEVGELVDSAFLTPQNLQALVVLNNSAIVQAIHVENPAGPILTLLDLPYTRPATDL